MAKAKLDPLAPVRGPLFSVRFVVALALMVLGIAWIAYYYVVFDPAAFPPKDSGSPGFMGDLNGWNYVIGFGLLMLGLVISAHPTTPLGRGRGVVVGMLGCFLIGLLWICTYYVFSNDMSDIWVFNDLGQKNLFVGIAFMAVGFTFATRWE
ncbi:cell division protein CrgA [Nocardioides sp. T2.26MG-1]|uniref:cell division protein CrgA n=1 Tax=Nocardioides sp. T2.26MG-1 TaxID=3041166 RepID=UPI002477830E|nr:cell division protein CrgA [Nocardioides sp. T2.26MG-1]CAI9402516.1 Cell division protein CrgA [Nocardioides sp. T2.26MG-1]